MNRTVDGGFSSRKFAGATAVLALHVLVIAAFLNATRWNDYDVVPTKEIVLHLIAPPTPRANEIVSPHRKTTAPRNITGSSLPVTSFVLPDAMRAPGASAPGMQFFDCSPDQLTTATPQQKAACAAASLSPHYNPNDVDFRDHTDRSKSAALWAEDRARKNAPLLLPCMSPAGFSPLYTAYCLGKGAVQGKIDLEDQLGYQDLPDHASNEGDTRMAPAPR